MDNIKEFKDKLFVKAKEVGFTDCEIYFIGGSSFEVNIFKGEIAQYKNSSPRGLAFRGTYNNKMGYSYTELLDESVIDNLVKSAKENALIIEHTSEKLYLGSEVYPEASKVSEFLNKTTVEEKINMAKLMESIALKENALIKSVDYSVIANGETEVYIANSHGLELQQSSGNIIAYISVRAENNGKVKVGNEIWGAKDFKEFNPEELSRKAVQKAVRQLDACGVKSGNYNVVIENQVAVNLMKTFVGSFYAENVQKGFSLLKDKIGEKIASGIVSIRDDISHPKSLQSLSFDSEGVATFNKVVIEKGILKTYLYNLKAANKEGKESTGNGFKSSFKGSIGTACANFYIEPSTSDFKDIICKLGNGILITNLSGLHSGTNNISGDFSLLADGFMVESGEIKYPVEQFTIAGNFFNMLKDIKAIGNDLYFSLSGEVVGSPSILVSNVTVAGE